MKALVIYDTLYGNTEQIAQTIGSAFSPLKEVEVVRVNKLNPKQLTGLKLLIIGSPTHGGRPTPVMQSFLKQLPDSILKGVNVSAFDTRLTARWVAIFGYAAGRIAETLKKKGGNLIASPEGFFVKGKKGPLKDGELERAASWVKTKFIS
ncbi:MAG TPA: flavodoxin [Elusimicrobia bacterium]|jgi:flavodoxin|nr:flavodoxin [Elusimicrobiota bacterium]